MQSLLLATVVNWFGPPATTCTQKLSQPPPSVGEPSLAVSEIPPTDALPTLDSCATACVVTVCGVGASDFNVTFSRPIACTVPAPPNPPCSAWPIFNGTVVLSGGQGITLKATNQGNSFVATATPFPTSFTFQLSSPITTGETVTLTTGITDNSTPALPMAHDVVIAATPDNVAPKPQTVVAQQVTQAPLYVLGSATVGGISLTAKLGSPTDGGGWNSFWVQVVTEGPNQFTTVQSNSNCTSSMASQYCVTIYTGGLPGGALTNALTADPIFTSLFVGSANGGASDAGPTHLAGGKTGLAVALVLNKPIDPIAAAGLGTYSLDVFGDGALTANDFIVEAVDNPAAPTIVAVVFSLTNFGVTLPPTAKLNVVNAPVSFAGLALTPSSIAIP